MNTLTPFLDHALEDRPGRSAPPEASGSRVSPPLGTDPQQPPVTPPSQPDGPGVQLPPPDVPGTREQVPHPSPHPAPSAHPVPMTDGTPAACFQRQAQAFLRGDVSGSVMAHYGEQLFGLQQHTRSAQPAPEEDDSGVRQLVEWREESPYG